MLQFHLLFIIPNEFLKMDHRGQWIGVSAINFPGVRVTGAMCHFSNHLVIIIIIITEAALFGAILICFLCNGEVSEPRYLAFFLLMFLCLLSNWLMRRRWSLLVWLGCFRTVMTCSFLPLFVLSLLFSFLGVMPVECGFYYCSGRLYFICLSFWASFSLLALDRQRIE